MGPGFTTIFGPTDCRYKEENPNAVYLILIDTDVTKTTAISVDVRELSKLDSATTWLQV